MIDLLHIEIIEVQIRAIEAYYSVIDDKHQKLICLNLLAEYYSKFSELNTKKGKLKKSEKW